ncbi:MAG: hypothetical protein M5U01_23995 [Ardenticatenaceae bacterium]|nr:hypothetical protein [Ardenticatenaceae bacterium]
MKPLRVYVDTSVFGGCFDREFSQPSQALFAAIQQGQAQALLSDILIAEIARAPQPVQVLLAQTIQGGAEVLEATQEAVELQEAYLTAGVVTTKFADDALHVAQATLARADVIASWNFRHLVHPTKVRGFNGVNVANGYGLMVVLTPADVVRILEDRENEQSGVD